jgi:hypothetical protein
VSPPHRPLARLAAALACACACAAAASPAAAAAGAPAGAAAAPAPADAALDELMQLLAARRADRVRFTEVRHLAILDAPLKSSGELVYEAPDHLEKRTLQPKPETLVLEHGLLTAIRGRHVRTLELAAWPQAAPLIESIRATLAGDRAALERAFAVRFAGDLGHWTLELTPRDPAAARLVREVRIAGERAVLESVEILEADGDRSVLTLSPEQ